MLARALIVILLTLNVGTALWWWSRGAPSVEATEPAASVVPSLQLLSERGAGTSSSGDDRPRCFSFGPFLDAVALDAARNYLQPRSARLGTHLQEAQAVAWRVMSPPQAGQSAARQLIGQLDAEGFDDHFVTRANDQYVVALGLFSSEPAARSRAAALQQAGFEASVQRVPSVPSGSWVDVWVRPDFDVVAAQSATGAEQVQVRPCDASA